MVYMFDIDGTLTPPRQKMSDEFARVFLKWMEGKTVYLVTGSDLKKVEEQIPENVLKKCVGIFTCMGNELYKLGKLQYRNEVKFPDQLIGWLQQQLDFTDYPTKTSNHFEYRPGMLNYSIVGRDATQEQRLAYYEWDKVNNERQRIATFINNKYPDYEACIGGQISIDIQERGKNKSQAYFYIKESYGKTFHKEPIYFFGDHCEDGGNDSAIAKEIDKSDSNDYYRNVSGPDDLLDFLTLLEDECIDI